jgi:hypothetical protein
VREVVYKDSKLRFKELGKQAAKTTYSAELIEGEWPSDDDLITLADGTIPPKGFHFGGVVYPLYENSKIVEVYTD